MRYSLIHAIQRSHFSVRTKLIVGFLIIAFFLLVLTVLSIIVIDDLGGKINQVSSSQQKVAKATLLNYNVAEFEQSVYDFSANLNTIETNVLEVPKGNLTQSAALSLSNSNFRDYVRYKNDLFKIRSRILDSERTLFMNDASVSNAAPFYNLIDNTFLKLINQSDKWVSDVQSPHPEAALNTWQELSKSLVDGRNTVHFFSQDLDNLVSKADKESKSAIVDASNAKQLSQWTLLIAGLVALVLAIAAGTLLTYVFTRPVERLRTRLIKLADGDLESGLDVPNRDQFGQLAHTFNQSIARLGSLVEQVQEQAVRVSSAAAQIATASSHSAEASIEQSGAVAQATVTIEELSRTAQQIAEAASMVASAAEEALDNASQGQETVKESIAGINRLQHQVRNITER
ncbi:MAG TPA: methyl-accepting chemotaxis protein, partial [Chloroflexia bacterium]|nr:methyl-accepting chemotaxis protein [Chloroflexia bacterium]